MSGSTVDPNPITIDDPGHKTHSSGGPGRTVNPGTGGNQVVLALQNSVLENLSLKQLQSIKICELEYARDLSTRAAQAYQQILDIVKAGAV